MDVILFPRKSVNRFYCIALFHIHTQCNMINFDSMLLMQTLCSSLNWVHNVCSHDNRVSCILIYAADAIGRYFQG